MKKIIPKEMILKFEKDGSVLSAIMTYSVYNDGNLLHRHRSISIKKQFLKEFLDIQDDMAKCLDFIKERENEMQ